MSESKRVPREPTPEMIGAILRVWEPHNLSDGDIRELWQAMYDAAPAAAEPDDRVDDGLRLATSDAAPAEAPPADDALDPERLRKLSRTELLRVLDEFRSERDAAKRDAMRAFDQRNLALCEMATQAREIAELRARAEAAEADARKRLEQLKMFADVARRSGKSNLAATIDAAMREEGR